MLNWLKYTVKTFRDWLRQKFLTFRNKEIENLYADFGEKLYQYDGLMKSVGYLSAQLHQKDQILAAIAHQNGGELVVPQDFMEIARSNNMELMVEEVDEGLLVAVFNPEEGFCGPNCNCEE